MCPQNYNLTLKQISIHNSELIPTYCYLTSAIFTPLFFLYNPTLTKVCVST